MNTPRPCPRISICIANYNGEELLPDCIDSVLSQGIDDVEILVHDDASNDGSLALLSARYPQVRIIASKENVGFCVANNRMAKAATGEYLLLLNNDAALHVDALRTLLSEANRIGPNAILTLPQYDWSSGALVDRGCLIDPFCNPVPNIDPDQADVAYVIGACMWVPRQLWHDLGGFPEWFGSIAEDMYLCCAARLRGTVVRCVEGSGYRHHQGASFGGNRADGALRTTYRRRALSERNKTRVLLICTPGMVVWPLLALHVLALGIEGLVLSLLRLDIRLWRKVYQPSLLLPLSDRKVIHEHRSGVQRSRTISLSQWLSTLSWQLRKLAMLRRYGAPTID